jgi:glucosamine kinase
MKTAQQAQSPADWADASFRLGVDGGGSGCRARLSDAAGHVLGEGEAGPANLALGIESAVRAVLMATRMALRAARLPETVLAQTSACLGLAGGNVPQLRRVFQTQTLPFRSTVLRSDAEIACLGAHLGQDGAILILGTGSQGIVQRAGEFVTVGGWGFALSDDGSGAQLGRAAVRRAFQAHEGIAESSALTRAILQRFSNELENMLSWSSHAKPKDWAVFARDVFDHARSDDAVALQLILESVDHVHQMLDRLISLGAKRISLMGGVAAPTRPYLHSRYANVLVEPLGDAMDGALWVAGRGTEALTVKG